MKQLRSLRDFDDEALQSKVGPGVTLCAWLRSVSSTWKEAADISDARTGRDCSLPTLPSEGFPVPRAAPLPNACPLGSPLSRALLATLQAIMCRVTTMGTYCNVPAQDLIHPQPLDAADIIQCLTGPSL